LQFINGLLSDYVNLLAKEHPTSARVVQANANMAIQQLQSSDRQVPEDVDADDRGQ